MGIKDIKETVRVLCANAVRETVKAETEEEIKNLLVQLVEDFVDTIDLGYADVYPKIREPEVVESNNYEYSRFLFKKMEAGEELTDEENEFLDFYLNKDLHLEAIEESEEDTEEETKTIKSS